MTVDEIKNGVVIDHIKAGQAMEIYKFLGLDKFDCTVAIIKNAQSRRMGKKDIIKIDSEVVPDLSVLGYIDHNLTVNIIKDGANVSKYHPELPLEIVDIVKCKNPRCITSTEQELDHVFRQVDAAHNIWRCAYCEGKCDPAEAPKE